MSEKECKHDYIVLDSNIETTTLSYGTEIYSTETNGYAVLYCKKCLDVKKKVFNL